VIDVPTLQSWLEKLGFDVTPDDATTLRIRWVVHEGGADLEDAGLPSFYVQCTENWVLLSILPLTEPGRFQRGELARRLLTFNREMRLAKFALDKAGAVVLCAELPTESLDYSEIAEAVDRMIEYARKYEDALLPSV
jgi:hypothetical protein